MESKSPAFTTPIFNPAEIIAPIEVETKKEPVVKAQEESSVPTEAAPTKVALFANSLKEKGRLIGDFDIPNDLSVEALEELILASAEKVVLSRKEQELLAKEQEHEEKIKSKYSEDLIQYAEHLAAGGSRESVTRASALHYWATLDPKTDEEKEDIVRVRYQIEDQSDDMIDAFIENKLNTPEALEAAYKESQRFIAQARLDELEADRLRGEQLRQQEQQRIDSESEQIKKAIRQGFHGIKLDETATTSLEQYMLAATHVRDIDTPNGKQRVSETAEAKTLREMTLEDRVLFGYLTQFGLKNLVAFLDKKGTDKFLQALEQADDLPTATKTRDKSKIALPPNAIKVPIRG